MPVTSRKLIVHKFSGAGKKAPTTLKYDPASRRTINVACFCKPIIVCCTDNIGYDAGNATSDYTIVIEDDGTGIPFDAGDAQTEVCS